MERLVAAASAGGLTRRERWLCYREPPGRYWILSYGESPGGFLVPGTLRGLVEHVGRAAGPQVHAELAAMLAGLEYETEWEILLQQKRDWSTVDSMSTDTHPEARVMERTIRPGRETAFDQALTARTAFLREAGYPLPVQGFVARDGAPGRAFQVVFPVNWSSFHEASSFYGFSKSLDEAGREAYAARKAALLETMSGAEYYHGGFAAELSYRPD